MKRMNERLVSEHLLSICHYIDSMLKMSANISLILTIFLDAKEK